MDALAEEALTISEELLELATMFRVLGQGNFQDSYGNRVRWNMIVERINVIDARLEPFEQALFPEMQLDLRERGDNVIPMPQPEAEEPKEQDDYTN